MVKPLTALGDVDPIWSFFPLSQALCFSHHGANESKGSCAVTLGLLLVSCGRGGGCSALLLGD